MVDDRDGGFDRRQTLRCMLWAGTGVVWTVAGGVPSSRLIGAASAAEGGFSFVQISDSHIGFEKPANPDARATLAPRSTRFWRCRTSPPSSSTRETSATRPSRRSSTTLSSLSAGRSSTSITRPASTTSSTPRRGTPISSASARMRLAAAGMRSTTAACISSRWSTSSTSRKTALAPSARRSSSGSRTISRTNPPRPRSSCSAISRSG